MSIRSKHAAFVAERRESLTDDALDLIRDGETVNEAARMLDIPASTLRTWLKRRADAKRLAAAKYTPPASWKVAVWTHGDDGPSYNGLRFPTADAAHAYGADLMSRWILVRGFAPEPSGDTPNR